MHPDQTKIQTIFPQVPSAHPTSFVPSYPFSTPQHTVVPHTYKDVGMPMTASCYQNQLNQLQKPYDPNSPNSPQFMNF
jgi:hypothetical protein